MMKEFLINHKKTIFFLSITIAIVILATIIILIFIGVTNYKKINSEIESVYTTFENTDDKTEKYNILTGFIADSKHYCKYQENEKNYQNKISEMKNHFVISYESLIKENRINISDKTTKEELSTAIANLNEVKKTINSNEIIQIDDLISEIDSEIENYKTKIAEIEAAEKAEEERLKKEAEEKVKKEAEERAKKEAEKIKKKNNSESSDKTEVNNSTISSETSTIVDSENFDPSGMTKSWETTEDGTMIPGTVTYHDRYGNVYDEYGNYRGNLSEWAWDW